MSIMDALAIAFTGDKVNRQIIERAYNLDPDLGEIAEILAQKGIEVVAQISISVGIPIGMMLASRVPYAQIQGKLGGEDFIAEYKYDGERTQVHKKGQQVRLFSRRLKEITDQYPDVVEAVKMQVKAEEAVLKEKWWRWIPNLPRCYPFK